MFSRINLKKKYSGGGSIVLALSDGLDAVREGSRDDEEIAFLANRIVRKSLAKGAITYDKYKNWRRKNPLIFTSIVDSSNRLIGFFDIFPLTSEAGVATLAGHLTERSFTIDHLGPLKSVSLTSHVHIATILVNPRQRSFSAIV